MNAHTSGRPRALVVYESMFGNTERIASAVSEGLRDSDFDVTCKDVCDVELATRVDADLLVVGAPTHGFSLSRPRTRADAVRQGAAANHASIGLREWLGQLPDQITAAPLVAVFDTRVSRVRRLPAAARKAAKLARHRGFQLIGAPGAFRVEDTPGPLNAGEVERAAHWAENIAGICLKRRGSAQARTRGRPH